MKRWMVLLLISVVVFGTLGYLYMQGEFEEYGWETFAMVLAAVAGPVKMLIYWTQGEESKDGKLKNAELKFTKTQKKDDKRRIKLALDVKEKETNLIKLEKDVELLSANIELLENRHKQVHQNIYMCLCYVYVWELLLDQAELQEKSNPLYHASYFHH